MKVQKYSVGDSLTMMCPACETEQDHSVASVTKLGKITTASCSVCATSSTFSRGVKTSISMAAGRSASPYDRTRRYRKGQTMLHSVFGQGEVTAIVDLQKMDVLFADRTRRLIHGQE
jgi:hypothetical protein